MGSGAGNLIGSAFIFIWFLPVMLGALLSLYLAGKGNRLLWILPMIALRLLSETGMSYIGVTGHQQLDFWMLGSEWMIAGILMVGAIGFRIFMKSRKKKLATRV